MWSKASKVLNPCFLIWQIGNPKQWRTSNGDVIKVETMESRRARELANAYIQLGAEYEDLELDQQERIRNLHAVQASFDLILNCNL